MKPFNLFIVLFVQIISSACFSQVPPSPPPVLDSMKINGKIFDSVEIEASYPGETKAWLQYLERNCNGQVAIENGAPVGQYTTMIQFIVDKDGKLSEFTPLTKMGYGMEQEVIRVLKLSGTWNPAIQNGKPVKAYRRQPITFQVEADGFNITSSTPFILYTGVENEITVQADKVKASDLRLTISQGNIKAGMDGKYIAHVDKPGRAVIILWDNKKNKEIGAASFEVIQK
jgi:GldM C-terminal domain/Gram-negative bacterial TonB protein C-terminal